MTGVDTPNKQTQNSPLSFTLYQNYPNPFNPKTEISYYLTEYCHVTIKVFNMLGQEVKVLIHENQEPGTYAITWDGRNDGW